MLMNHSKEKCVILIHTSTFLVYIRQKKKTVIALALIPNIEPSWVGAHSLDAYISVKLALGWVLPWPISIHIIANING